MAKDSRQKILEKQSRDSEDGRASPDPDRSPKSGVRHNMVKNVTDKLVKRRGSTVPEDVPKYLFSIHSPLAYTVAAQEDRAEEAEELVQTVWKPYASQLSGQSGDTDSPSSSPHLHKKKITIRMASLIQKMLKRLISDNVIVARERVLVTTTQSHIFVRVLTVERNVPILLMRCERIGIGNVVGACWVTPIDLAVVPSVSATARDESIKSLRGIGVRDNPSLRRRDTEEMDLELGEGGTSSDFSFDCLSKSNESPPLQPRLTSDESAISIGSEDYDSDVEGDGSMEVDPGANDRDSERKRDRAQKLLKEVAEARKKWVDVTSRMRITQVLDEVTAGARFGFDYVCYVLIAAWIAGFGLAHDSATTVIASMLVSPLMGPVMGITFGTMVREKKLVLMSFRNEMISLALCVFVGFIIGLLFVSEVFGATYKQWPQSEMTSRGDPYGLIYGVLIALPSGMAVALSTLGKNSGGLTGVAISLSLLPPAVNAGLCWCTALLVSTGVHQPSLLPAGPDEMGCLSTAGYTWCPDFQTCVQPFVTECPSLGNVTTLPINGTMAEHGKETFEIDWTLNPGDETNYATVGTVSFLLTLINIVCIWMGGCFMFWLKEVAPIRSKNTFWTHDIKAYREAKTKYDDIRRSTKSWTKSEMEAIERGIRASFILDDIAYTESAKKENNTRYSHPTSSIDAMRSDYHHAHHAYASNALEDALFAHNADPSENHVNFRARPSSMQLHAKDRPRPRTYAESLQGGKAHTYHDVFRIHEESESEVERKSVLRTTNYIPGGLSEAGSVLFSSSLANADESQVDEVPSTRESFFTSTQARRRTPLSSIFRR